MWAALFRLPGFLLAHRQAQGDLALTGADDALAHLQEAACPYSRCLRASLLCCPEKLAGAAQA